jgi:hypothetical protein
MCREGEGRVTGAVQLSERGVEESQQKFSKETSRAQRA